MPALLTVIDGVTALLLQSSVPPASVDNVVVPQLFTTVTPGVAGTVFGAATADAAGLVQPFTVEVSV